MMQIQLGTTGVIVLEPMNVENLKQGRFLKVDMTLFRGPQLETLVIDWTPDLDWCHEKLAALIEAKGPQNVLPSEMQSVIRESKNRPEVKNRTQHGMIDVVKFATAKGPTN